MTQNPFSYESLLSFPFSFDWIILAAFVWVFVWKGLALWKAARLSAKWWFIALLVVNTFGILEILFYYVFSERIARGKKPEHDTTAPDAGAPGSASETA